jgi:hypothetical protein
VEGQRRIRGGSKISVNESDTVDGSSDPYALHRMRIITCSGLGKIIEDTLQPWSQVSVVNADTGDTPNFPASEVPSGVLRRDPDGRETLQTVEGLRLELDGAGNITAYDDSGALSGPGIFMVVEVLPEEQRP